MGKKQRLRARLADVYRRLEALYRRIPDIPDCDGRCWTSCGAVAMSRAEHERIRRQSGIKISPAEVALAQIDTFWCEALTADRRCAVYAIRPTACRLWGTTRTLQCPYGCVPEGGFIPDGDGYWLNAEAARIGGHPDAFPGMPQGAQLREVMNSPRMLEAMAPVMEAGRAGHMKRVQGVIPAAFRRPAGPGESGT